MPIVVPMVTSSTLWNRADSSQIAICVSSPISTTKKATSVVRKMPCAETFAAFSPACRDERPARHGNERHTQFALERGAGQPLRHQIAERRGDAWLSRVAAKSVRALSRPDVEGCEPVGTPA